MEKSDEQKEFDEKVNSLHEEFKNLAEKYNAGLLLAIYFKKEDLSGVHSYGDLNHVEEAGLAKQVEQKFIA